LAQAILGEAACLHLLRIPLWPVAMQSTLFAVLLSAVLCVCCLLLSGCNDAYEGFFCDPYGFTCTGDEWACVSDYEHFNCSNETAWYGKWAVCVNQELQSCSSCTDPEQFCDEMFCERRRCQCEGELAESECFSRYPLFPTTLPDHGVCSWYISGEIVLGYYACNGSDLHCRPEDCDISSSNGTTKAVCINQTFASCTSSNGSDRNQTFCHEKMCECEGHVPSSCATSRLLRGR